MSCYEAQIRTQFGQLIIHFDSSKEFAERLKSLDTPAITSAIEEYLSRTSIGPLRQIKSVLEGVCAFTPEGNLEFLRPPKEKLEAIGIVLYAFDPEPVKAATVRKLAAVKKPVDYLGHKNYKEYFEKVRPGVYRLTHKGKLWITNEVIPKLLAKTEGRE